MNQTKKKPWRWDPINQQAFDNVKAARAKETVLAYPDFSKPFEIYMDASSAQLGAVITQDNGPIAFFSSKLTKMQQKYSVTEIELLAIVETLKEFKGMLWGQDIKVYTDHKNLTRDALGLTSDRVFHWRLLLEEYAPEIIYIKGIHNTVVDAILRLEYDPKLKKTISTLMLCLVWNQKNWTRSDGNLLRTIDVATMKPARQRNPTAFTWMKCLQIAVMRTKYTL